MPRMPTCPNCRAFMKEGPHLHPEQCIKAKRHETHSLQEAVVSLAIRCSGQSQENAKTMGLLWNVLMKLGEGGRITVPDAGLVEVPEGKVPRLALTRTEEGDGVLVEALLEDAPAEPQPAGQAEARA